MLTYIYTQLKEELKIIYGHIRYPSVLVNLSKINLITSKGQTSGKKAVTIYEFYDEQFMLIYNSQ